MRPEHDYTETTTDLHPYEPVGDFDASFTIGLRVPGMKSALSYDGDDPNTGPVHRVSDGTEFRIVGILADHPGIGWPVPSTPTRTAVTVR